MVEEDKTSGERRQPASAWVDEPAGIDTNSYLRIHRGASPAQRRSGEALDFYTRLFLEAPLAIVIATPDLRITDANVAAQQLLNRAVETIRGEPFQRFIASDDRRAFVTVSDKLKYPPFRITRPFRLVVANASAIEVSLTACALKDKSGEPELVMMIFLDRGDDATEDML